jgi:hypothetical protein
MLAGQGGAGEGGWCHLYRCRTCRKSCGTKHLQSVAFIFRNRFWLLF